MKNLKIVPIGAIAILMVFLASCSPFQQTGGERYDEGYGDRRSAYIDEPIYYNSNRPVLVRDAYTGKLFYVYPNNSYSPYGYGSRYDNGFYDQRLYSNQRVNRSPRKQVQRPAARGHQGSPARTRGCYRSRAARCWSFARRGFPREWWNNSGGCICC